MCGISIKLSTPTSHSNLNFTLKSCIFNIVLYNLEPRSYCIWALGLLAQAVMSQRGQRQLVERTQGQFPKRLFCFRGISEVKRSLKWFWQIGFSLQTSRWSSLSSSNTPNTSPLLFDMVKQKPSVPLLIWFQWTHLLGVIFILYNEWTNRHSEVHDWAKVIWSQEANPLLSPGSALFPGSLLGSEKRSLI